MRFFFFYLFHEIIYSILYFILLYYIIYLKECTSVLFRQAVKIFQGKFIKKNFRPLWREEFTFIPKRGFIFARVKTGQVGTWSLVE